MPNEIEPTQDERYQSGLTELIEKKKLGLLSQDAYDAAHKALVTEVFGERPRED